MGLFTVAVQLLDGGTWTQPTVTKFQSNISILFFLLSKPPSPWQPLTLGRRSRATLMICTEEWQGSMGQREFTEPSSPLAECLDLPLSSYMVFSQDGRALLIGSVRLMFFSAWISPHKSEDREGASLEILQRKGMAKPGRQRCEERASFLCFKG